MDMNAEEEEYWTVAKSRILSMILAPLVSFGLTSLGLLAFDLSDRGATVCLYLALVSLTIGFVSSIWVLFGPSSVMIRSLGFSMMIINMSAIFLVSFLLRI